MRASIPAVFIDKDGTVLEDVPYNVDPALMRLAPGAAQGLRELGALGCPLIVVSNQCGVAEGRFREAELIAVRLRLEELFAEHGARLQAFLYCPHARDGTGVCGCRKPAPGLLLAAAAHFGLDLAQSWMIGDILDDVEAAHRAGCRAVLIDNGNETVWRGGTLRWPERIAGDFLEAARAVAAAMQPVCAA